MTVKTICQRGAETLSQLAGRAGRQLSKSGRQELLACRPDTESAPLTLAIRVGEGAAAAA